eukprot:TRINITY_DN17377_c0_g1_i3.p1 TRINITY_DN17377_c0_g1~~TRINITY_DN17377_c0_g1_i3.p1  ORF type:complete len:265 (+),score=17.43 TRINITY_DN17377_c0_g1_i3:56-850(+)
MISIQNGALVSKFTLQRPNLKTTRKNTKLCNLVQTKAVDMTRTVPQNLGQSIQSLTAMAGPSGFSAEARDHQMPQLIEKFEQIANQAQEAGFDVWDKESILGSYTSLLSTDVLQLAPDGKTTLGRLTFGQVAPIDIGIQLGDVGSQIGSTYYKIQTKYDILQSGLKGLHELFAEVEFDIENSRLGVQFKTLIHSPQMEEQKNEWIKFMSTSNSSNIDKEGVVTINFENMPKGYFAIKCLTPTHLVGQGNRGGWQLLEKRGNLSP